jgi:hypothetical protein
MTDDGDVGNFELLAHPSVVAGSAYCPNRHLRVGNNRRGAAAACQLEGAEVSPFMDPFRPQVLLVVRWIGAKHAGHRHARSILAGMKTAFCHCLLAGLILFPGLWSESQILPSSDAGQANILLKGSVVANNIQTAIAGHLALDPNICDEETAAGR